MTVAVAEPLLLAVAFVTVAVKFPGCHLVRNDVGNLVIRLDASGIGVGWVDLQTATVYDIDGEMVQA